MSVSLNSLLKFESSDADDSAFVICDYSLVVVLKVIAIPCSVLGL